MDLKPTSENGKRVFTVLRTWSEKAPASALDRLKRLFLRYSLQMQNEDAFVTALYAQSILDESPTVLSHRFSTTLLRVQYAMETALNKKSVKELIVALELSENGSILTEVLNWTEENSQQITEAVQRLSIDLAPVRIQKWQKLSQINPGAINNPRTREISLDEEGKCCSALEVCKNEIIVGWNNGEIRIYSGTDLHYQTVLSYCASKASVTCLQCTCTEIIAGYSDGNICLWNIKKKTLVRTFSVKNEKVRTVDYADCMRWRAPRLVVCTVMGSVKILQFCNTSITPLGSWDERPMLISHVDFNDTYVVLQRSLAVDIRYFNGQQIRSISNSKMQVHGVALDRDHVITGCEDKVVRIWNISTGACLKELEGHDSPVRAVDAHGGVIATRDSNGGIIIWNAKAAWEGKQAKLAAFTHANIPSAPLLKLGENVVVAGFPGKPTIQVTDFLM